MSRDFVYIDIDGKERKFRFDFNAVADVEDALGKDINEIFQEGKGMGLRTIRALMWAGLKGSEKGLTVARTGAIINDFLAEGGSVETLSEFIDKGLRASYLFRSVAQDEQKEEAETEEESDPN
jgi:hypothetical protein